MPPGFRFLPRIATGVAFGILFGTSADQYRRTAAPAGYVWPSGMRSRINYKKSFTMHLTPKEIDKLMLLSLGMVAERRMKKGLKLNYPEAVAYITSTALEGAREGKTVEEVMKGAASVLKKSDVMEGVADMIDLLQVEAVFTDGSRLVSIHHPIK